MRNKLQNKVLFAKMNNEVKIPTKREEDGAFDVYANFKEDYILIKPHETKMIPTGLCSAFSSDYVAILKERGSTGTKGIGQRAGVVDSGYRGQWFVPVTNHNEVPLIIIKDDVTLTTKKERMGQSAIEITSVVDKEGNTLFTGYKGEYVSYQYEKGICQVIMVEVPKLTTEEITMEELLSYESERGNKCLGSSGK